MKILVVQLLRLGDILMSAPMLSGLKRKYPHAEIHVLAFKQFAQIEGLFAEKFHWHFIDRNGLQDALSDANVSFFHAEELLQSSLAPLRAAKFDTVYNLTQTKLSGWICAYIGCPQTIGLHFDPRGNARFGSPWFQYLNDHMSAGQGEVFHYVDLFRFACDLDGVDPQWNFNRADVKTTISTPYILVQPLTSDEKKNYPLEQWKQVFSLFRLSRPNYKIGVLAAPNEVEILAEAFGDVPNVLLLECSLAEALTYMDRAELLVTGDTSIKHLACASLLPVIELSLGSSDYRRTGIYKTGSFILHGKAVCAPCPHSGPCSQSTHLCSKQLSPEAVSLAMHAMLGHPGAVTDFAHEFGPQLQWLESFISPMGFWLTKDLQAPSIEWDLVRCIEKSTWKFVLQRELASAVGRFGTESVQIRRTFQERFANFSSERFNEELDFLESETIQTDHNVTTVLNSMQWWMERPTDISRQEQYLDTVREFCSNTRNASAIGSWLGGSKLLSLDDSKTVSFDRVRRLQAQLDEMVQRTRVRLKLIRSLKSNAMERI